MKGEDSMGMGIGSGNGNGKRGIDKERTGESKGQERIVEWVSDS